MFVAAAQPPIDQIVRKITDAFHPRRIILFGSRARGDNRPDSDVDLMVELESTERPIERTARVYQAVYPAGCPLDLIVFTPEEIDASRGDRYSFVRTIESEGKLLYERR